VGLLLLAPLPAGRQGGRGEGREGQGGRVRETAGAGDGGLPLSRRNRHLCVCCGPGQLPHKPVALLRGLVLLLLAPQLGLGVLILGGGWVGGGWVGGRGGAARRIASHGCIGFRTGRRPRRGRRLLRPSRAPPSRPHAPPGAPAHLAALPAWALGGAGGRAAAGAGGRPARRMAAVAVPARSQKLLNHLPLVLDRRRGLVRLHSSRTRCPGAIASRRAARAPGHAANGAGRGNSALRGAIGAKSARGSPAGPGESSSHGDAGGGGRGYYARRARGGADLSLPARWAAAGPGGGAGAGAGPAAARHAARAAAGGRAPGRGPRQRGRSWAAAAQQVRTTPQRPPQRRPPELPAVRAAGAGSYPPDCPVPQAAAVCRRARAPRVARARATGPAYLHNGSPLAAVARLMRACRRGRRARQAGGAFREASTAPSTLFKGGAALGRERPLTRANCVHMAGCAGRRPVRSWAQRVGCRAVALALGSCARARRGGMSLLAYVSPP
jgi:hypothetical protein